MLDKRALAKAKINRDARLALFDYHNQNHEEVNHKPPKVVKFVPARDRNEHKASRASIYKGSIYSTQGTFCKPKLFGPSI